MKDIRRLLTIATWAWLAISIVVYLSLVHVVLVRIESTAHLNFWCHILGTYITLSTRNPMFFCNAFLSDAPMGLIVRWVGIFYASAQILVVTIFALVVSSKFDRLADKVTSILNQEERDSTVKVFYKSFNVSVVYEEVLIDII